MFWLNVGSIVMAVVFAVLMIGWMAWVYASRDPVTASTQIPALFLWIGVIMSLPLHEWIHGLVIRWGGHKPIYGMKFIRVSWVKLPLALYATAGDVYFRRYPFIVIALAPMVVITLGCMAMIVLLPDYLTYYLMLAAIINGSGSIGDLWMTMAVLRYPHDALVRDEADSIRIYVRDS
jgi:hypothetical protein